MKASNVFYALIMGLLLVYSYSCQKDEHKVDESKAVAVLTTNEITEIEQTTAVSGGNISDDGGTLVTARGVCWSTSKTPTISDSKTEDGTGSGSFISNITDLEPSTTYHVRAYATNSNGTGYGTTYSFKTLEAVIPTLTTTEISEITQTTAVSGGDISNDGSATVIVRGVCWSTKDAPTIDDNKTENGNGTGTFISNIAGLEKGTTYYVRAYATNSKGTSYGKTYSFKTLNIPTLTTKEITGITQTTAVSGGNISDDGGAAVTARGVCWSTNQSPNINDSKTSNSSGKGSFNANITNLVPNTTYYVRAYATNSEGTGYGTIYSFKTLEAVIPTLTTTKVSEITQTTAFSGGDISNDGGEAVTARGVCWSTKDAPSIDDNKTEDGNGTGVFISSITGLEIGTTYYVRAYATNNKGTGYGSVFSFTIYQTFTDSRDGNVYKFVTIGNQVWMAENLKYLPAVVRPATGSYTTPYYYVYGYDGTDKNAAKATSNYNTYGVLYNWPAAMAGSASSEANPSGVKGVCPTGWHLPSDAEWTQLTDYLGGTAAAGGKLKETGTVHWISPNTAATNETGFTALPGGNRYGYGSFGRIGYDGRWWSASELDATNAWSRYMSSNYSNVTSYNYNKEVGFSVRCVRD